MVDSTVPQNKNICSLIERCPLYRNIGDISDPELRLRAYKEVSRECCSYRRDGCNLGKTYMEIEKRFEEK